MKRIVTMCALLVLLVGMCSTAQATTFTKTVQCYNENGAYEKTALSNEMIFCTHHLYVQYNAQGCSNSYTNHFRGYCEDGLLINSKWITPGGGYYIESAGFCEGWRYYLTMRGNTRYYENEGLTNIVLAGWFDPNK